MSKLKSKANALKKISNGVSMTDKEIESILDEAIAYCASLTPSGTRGGAKTPIDTFWERTENGYRVVQQGESVMYLEYGTGTKGEESPHDMYETEWVYNIGTHIFTTKDGRKGWFFPDTPTTWKFTQGQKANMQMYKTAIFLSERLHTEIIRKRKWAKSQW